MGCLEFASAEQSLTSRPLQSSSEGCYCCLGLSDTSSPGPTQDPRSGLTRFLSMHFLKSHVREPWP